MSGTHSTSTSGKSTLVVIDSVFGTLLLILTALTPLFFWNLTTEFYETPKFLILVAVTSLMLITWALRLVVSTRINITRTSLDLPLLLLVVTFIISTFFSQARWISIYGNLPRINGGLVSVITLAIFYFTLVSNLKLVTLAKQMIYTLVGSSIILSVLSLIAYSGQTVINLPFTQGVNFTPTGSNFSTNALLILSLPFLMLNILKTDKGALVTKTVSSILLVLFSVTIVLTGTLPIYIAALLALALILFNQSTALSKNIPFIALPLVITAVTTLLSLSPLGGSQNLLYKQAQNFSKEVQLPLNISWKVAISAFRDSPIWGSGPGTFLSDFTTYRPVEFNTLKTWNVRFDQAFNEYLGVLATTGIAGLTALLLMTIVYLSTAIKTLKEESSIVASSLAASGILFFILLALHASTIVLWITGLIILASFMAVNKKPEDDISMGLVTIPDRKIQGQIGGQNVQLEVGEYVLLPYLASFIVLALVGTAWFFIAKTVIADFNHRQALNAAALGQGLDAYNYLVKAESLNPFIDLYRSDLAQTNFALANAIAINKGPSEASPAGSLTDQDKQNIQTLLSQAINEGKAAVTLNPNNPGNWEILGSIYRQISGAAQNALSFSLDSYGRAIQKDPLNPALRLSVGGIYYAAGNFDMAVRFFSDAVNLKPDYANGYYNLAMALKEKGNLKEAVAAAEKTVSLLEPESPDYEVASNFLSSLKEKESKIAAEQEGEELEKASKTDSALENKKLPKVLNLPKPENIATPEAVKAPQP